MQASLDTIQNAEEVREVANLTCEYVCIFFKSWDLPESLSCIVLITGTAGSKSCRKEKTRRVYKTS